ncbi:MAG: transglutaminase family protein [Bacteroidetes bacterium]|nr:transglutaminase family protein [Bacteroidota bacterium]
MPRFNIHHVTKYTYESPVRDSANQIVLFPIEDQYQEVMKQQLFISGEPDVEKFKDYYGNEIGLFMNAEPHTELTIDSKVEVITRSKQRPSDDKNKEAQWANIYAAVNDPSYIDFLKQEQFNALDEVRVIANADECIMLTPLKAAERFNEYVYTNFKYIKGVTSVETTIDEIWKLKAGVCQDFAHILLVMLRMICIPARYVSGYICPNKNGMRGEGATHAWVEAYIPFYGWLGLDPTNNCIVDDLHVRLAVGRNFSDCSPVKGTYKGTSDHVLEVGVSVSYEDGKTSTEEKIVLTPQSSKNGTPQNSYRKYMEMMQQQQ